MRTFAAIGLLVPLAGCFAATSGPGSGADDAAPNCGLEFAEGILLGDAGPGGLASEPSIAFGPDGTIAVASIWVPAHLLPVLVAGQGTGFVTWATPGPDVEPGAQNGLWVSRDGVTFTAHHDALGRIAQDGHQGSQDADVAIAPDGSWHLALYGPTGIEVISSFDGGGSWTPSGRLSPQSVDRQWIQASPNGTLVVAWNQFGSAGNVDPPATGVGYAVSDDAGRTWRSHRTLDPEVFSEGPIALHNGTPVLPVRDRAGTLQVLPFFGRTARLPGIPGFGGAPGFVVPLSLGEGRLALFWTQPQDDGSAQIAWQVHDDGVWTEPVAVSSRGNAVFAWPVLRPDGSLVVFSYQADESGDPSQGVRTWDLAFDLLCGGASSWRHGLVAAGVHVGSMCLEGASCTLGNPDASSNDRSVGEIFEAGVDAQGRTWVAWTGTAGPARNDQIWIAGERVLDATDGPIK